MFKKHLLIFVLATALLNTVAATDLVVKDSPNTVQVSLTYNGEAVKIFGVVPDGSEALIKVTGPEDKIKLSKKGKVGVFWMNVRQVEVEAFPSMYIISSSSKISQLLSEKLQNELKIDPAYSAISEKAVVKEKRENGVIDITGADKKEFIDGLIKIKEEQELYKIKEGDITVAEGKLFDSVVFISSKATPGDYRVDVYAIQNGNVVAHDASTITVKNVGIGGWLTETAAGNGVLYGAMAVCIALIAGTLVGFIFRGRVGAH